MTMTQEPTIEAPLDEAERTGDQEAYFDHRFIDAQVCTLATALREYLERRGENTAAEAVGVLETLALYLGDGELRRDIDLGAGALAQMSVLVPRLGGGFHSPGGISV